MRPERSSRTLLLGATLLSFIAAPIPAIIVAARSILIEATPLVIAIQDYYKEDPNSAFINGLPDIWLNSTVDLPAGAEVHILHDAPAHPDLRVITTVAEVYYRIVANKKSNITTLADLKGKRIGIVRNTTSEYFAYRFLHDVAGFKDSEYTLVATTQGARGLCFVEPCGNDTFPSMLARGEIDAMTAYEPTSELAIRAIGEENAVVFRNDSLYRELSVMYTTEAKLKDPAKRKEIVKFLKALNKVQRVFENEPEKIWGRVSSVSTNVSVEVLEKIWPLTKWSGGLPDDMVDILAAEDEWIAKDTTLRPNRGPMSKATLAAHIDAGPYFYNSHYTTLVEFLQGTLTASPIAPPETRPAYSNVVFADTSSFMHAILATSPMLASPTEIRVNQCLVKIFTPYSAVPASKAPPWEIFRPGPSRPGPSHFFNATTLPNPHAVTTVGKDGVAHGYRSRISLLPTDGLGLAILTAGDQSALPILLDGCLTVPVPTIDAVAREQAVSQYVGSYTSTNATSNTSTTATFVLDETTF
ncbi:hypothetical protein OQA88_12683 [Cercophora sp. LCS_1]